MKNLLMAKEFPQQISIFRSGSTSIRKMVWESMNT